MACALVNHRGSAKMCISSIEAAVIDGSQKVSLTSDVLLLKPGGFSVPPPAPARVQYAFSHQEAKSLHLLFNMSG